MPTSRTALVLQVLLPGKAPPSPACVQYVVSHILGPAASGQAGEWQTHTYSGCKLTSESQLCCFSASGHFYVGLGSFCETSLECAWGSLIYPPKTGPSASLVCPLEEFCGNPLYLALGSRERERQDRQPGQAARAHNPAHSDCLAACRVAQRATPEGSHHHQGPVAARQEQHMTLKRT